MDDGSGSGRRAGLPVLVPAGATAAELLLAAYELLLNVAAAEAGVRYHEDGVRVRLPPPLAGRAALAALCRVWDALGEQPPPPPTPPHSAPPETPGSMRLAGADVDLLAAAAHALAHPTPELAVLLGQLQPRRGDPAALARLLAVLPPADASPPPTEAAPPSA